MHKGNTEVFQANHSPQYVHPLSHNQSFTTQCIFTVPQPITLHSIYIYSPTNTHHTKYIYWPQPITYHTLFIYCPTTYHSPHNVYLLSHKKSLTTQYVSSVPKPIKHHKMHIYCPTTNYSPHNIYVLSHKQSLTTQCISTVPQTITHHTICI